MYFTKDSKEYMSLRKYSLDEIKKKFADLSNIQFNNIKIDLRFNYLRLLNDFKDLKIKQIVREINE